MSNDISKYFKNEDGSVIANDAALVKITSGSTIKNVNSGDKFTKNTTFSNVFDRVSSEADYDNTIKKLQEQIKSIQTVKKRSITVYFKYTHSVSSREVVVNTNNATSGGGAPTVTTVYDHIITTKIKYTKPEKWDMTSGYIYTHGNANKIGIDANLTSSSWVDYETYTYTDSSSNPPAVYMKILEVVLDNQYVQNCQVQINDDENHQTITFVS